MWTAFVRLSGGLCSFWQISLCLFYFIMRVSLFLAHCFLVTLIHVPADWNHCQIKRCNAAVQTLEFSKTISGSSSSCWTNQHCHNGNQTVLLHFLCAAFTDQPSCPAGSSDPDLDLFAYQTRHQQKKRPLLVSCARSSLWPLRETQVTFTKEPAANVPRETTSSVILNSYLTYVEHIIVMLCSQLSVSTRRRLTTWL